MLYTNVSHLDQIVYTASGVPITVPVKQSISSKKLGYEPESIPGFKKSKLRTMVPLLSNEAKSSKIQIDADKVSLSPDPVVMDKEENQEETDLESLSPSYRKAMEALLEGKKVDDNYIFSEEDSFDHFKVQEIDEEDLEEISGPPEEYVNLPLIPDTPEQLEEVEEILIQDNDPLIVGIPKPPKGKSYLQHALETVPRLKIKKGLVKYRREK